VILELENNNIKEKVVSNQTDRVHMLRLADYDQKKNQSIKNQSKKTVCDIIGSESRSHGRISFMCF